MLNQVLKLNCTQEYVSSLLRISNIFLDFQLSQGSVATYCRCCGNRCDVYIDNFPVNELVKEFETRSTFSKVIIEHQGVYFLRHSV